MERYNDFTEWQENISALPDEKLFEIIRLYLGEIRTPYNKQRLIEQLAGFIRNEKNLNTMISLLDEFDIKVLTAIYYIPNADRNLLVDFFSTEYSLGDIYSELSNLTLRLLVYTEKDRYTDKRYLRINPLVSDRLEPFIRLENILSESSAMSYSMDDVFCLSPGFLSAFISFLNMNGCSCKADGSIRKNDSARIEKIFPGKLKCIQLLLSAFVNLGLVFEDDDKKYAVDKKKLDFFVNLEEKQQYALLCAASCSRFSREGLKKETQLLLDCISSIPEAGYTRQTLIRLAFIIGARATGRGTAAPKSRFSRILESAKMEQSVLSEGQAGSLIDQMVDSAIEFGLLHKLGLSEDGEEIFVPGTMMTERSMYDSADDVEKGPKVLNVEPTFAVTMMPGLSLKKLVPLSEFLAIKNCAVVTEYEITRQSISYAFDKGWNPQSIFEELSRYTNYELPQNLRMTIDDWYATYTSAILYHGYVLKVAQNNVTFVENNPKIKKYIKEKLADGIYMLNVPVDSDIQGFITESGLDFMGRINNPALPGERVDFPMLMNGRKLSLSQEDDGKKSVEQKIDFSAAGDILGNLKAELEKLELSPNQKETLKNKICQRVILTKEQLAAASVKTEILEADGMDYLGKVHLFEAAIKAEDIMEITLPQYNKPNEYFTVVGKPLSLIKQYADSIVKIELLPEHNVENLVVSRMTHVRRLKI